MCLWDRDEPLVRETANVLASKGRVETAVMNVAELNSVKDAAWHSSALAAEALA